MRHRYWYFILLISIALSNVGGCNLYQELAVKNTDAAITIEVQKLIDASLFNPAIAKWNTLSPAGQATRSNQVLLASAYAGAGGLTMLGLAQHFQSSTGSKTIFADLLSLFTGSTYTQYQDLVMAQNILLNISPSGSGRTGDENTFMLFIEFAKLGTLFASLGDPTGTGTVSATWDNCSLGNSDASEVVIAVGNILDALAAIGTSLVGSSVNGLQSVCSNPVVSASGACGVTQVSQVTPAMAQVGKTLVGESNLGIGLSAPYNINFCQIALAPIVPGNCPGGIGGAAQTLCP